MNPGIRTVVGLSFAAILSAPSLAPAQGAVAPTPYAAMAALDYVPAEGSSEAMMAPSPLPPPWVLPPAEAEPPGMGGAGGDAGTGGAGGAPAGTGGAPMDGGGGAPPLPAPWIGANAGAPGTGHVGPPQPYNIYTWNCHSNTNQCTLTAPPEELRGPLVCNAGAVNTPAVHSASWAVFDSEGWPMTCLYNYGQACCWFAEDSPPDISAGDGQTCAQWACGVQYSAAGTQTLPAGSLVEIPGYAACIRETATSINSISVNAQQIEDAMANAAGNQAACLSCCDRRGNMWNGTGYDAQALRWDFISNCRTLCNGFYGNGVTLGQQYGSSTCAPSTSMWSVSSRYEQCRGCCLDGAISGGYPRQDVNACLGVCAQTFP